MAEAEAEAPPAPNEHDLLVARQLALLMDIKSLVDGSQPAGLTAELQRTAGMMALRKAGPLVNSRAPTVRSAARLIRSLSAILAGVEEVPGGDEETSEPQEGADAEREPALVS